MRAVEEVKEEREERDEGVSLYRTEEQRMMPDKLRVGLKAWQYISLQRAHCSSEE